MKITISKIMTRLYWFLKIGYRFVGYNSSIKGSKGSSIEIAHDVIIRNSNIHLDSNSTLKLSEGTVIENVNLRIKGRVVIGNHNFINNGNKEMNLPININGDFYLGSHNRIQSSISLRYNGSLNIGDYNNINTGSEIRVDENIVIGSFNQFSYNVTIWDTNTHCIYPVEKRRNLAIEKFPIFGYEFEKPKTEPIYIGNDCWIGKEVAILKGVIISDKCIIGFRTILTNCKVKKSTTVVTDIKNMYLPNNL